MSRTAKQYNAFRKAFKKWFAKYRPALGGAIISEEKGFVELVGPDGEFIAEYHAPDYGTYIAYVLRRYRINEEE